MGYEGMYEVSSHGRVRSLPRLNHRGYRQPGREMRIHPNVKSGHLFVGLTRQGVATSRTVHTLVLEAFVGPRPPGCETRHLNSNPADNNISNLRWGTRSENNGDRTWRYECALGHSTVGMNATRDGRCRACNTERSESYRRGVARRPERANEIYEGIRSGLRPNGRRFKP